MARRDGLRRKRMSALWYLLSPPALLGAGVCLIILLVSVVFVHPHELGRPVLLDADASYQLSGSVSTGDHIMCAFRPPAGQPPFDREFTVPPSTSGKHSKTTTIGTFAVPKSGTYTVDCRSNGQPVHRASIDPPTPEWVSIDIAIGSALLLFGIAWPIYVFLRRRRFSRSGTLEIMSEVADF